MSVLRPFKAIRPKKEYASKVAALPYDVMNSEEAREMVKGNPYSFLHVDKAEIDLPKDTYIYSEEVYDKAYENLSSLVSDGVLQQDEKPCIYIYEQTREGKVQTGIVGCASIDDYMNNVIKKHELTRADKEADRIHLLTQTQVPFSWLTVKTIYSKKSLPIGKSITKRNMILFLTEFVKRYG